MADITTSAVAAPDACNAIATDAAEPGSPSVGATAKACACSCATTTSESATATSSATATTMAAATALSKARHAYQ